MKSWLSGCVLASLIALARLALARTDDIQAPLLDHNDDGPFKTFRHSELPTHSIRIKEQSDEVCEAGSKQYTGWLDFNGRHMFFWYFDSLNDPLTDPLTLWLTGGPGVSSMVGLLLEVGPCRISPGGEQTHRNPYSWTKNSSMIFVDQPVGTGLSYVDPETTVPTTSTIAARDMYIFLQIFLTEVFPDRRHVPFHISGESYAGHYIPKLSEEILRQNIMLRRPGIPLKSILIGNGYISPSDILFGYYETLCTIKPGVDEPIFNQTRCQIIAENLPRCLYVYEACYKYPDEAVCRATDTVCGVISQLFHNESHAGGRDPFDITRTCEVDHLCYAQTLDIQKYINKPSTWKALEIPQAISNFSIESEEVSSAFQTGIDLYTNVMNAVKYTLENGVDVLIYNGNLDLACNTAGNMRWMNALRWNGQAALVSQDLNSWYSVVGGRQAQVGSYKEIFASARPGSSEQRRFAFVTINRSGHMVPLDQPEVALDIYRKWLFQQPFGWN